MFPQTSSAHEELRINKEGNEDTSADSKTPFAGEHIEA